MSKMSNTNFKLQTNCLHLTYTSDYCNQLTIDMIIDHLKYKWVNRKKISIYDFQKTQSLIDFISIF